MHRQEKENGKFAQLIEIRMNKNERYMLEAVKLARKNLDKKNGGPFGAIVVKNGEIIASGVNTVTSDHDPTAHAEMNAIREACSILKTHQLQDCEIYSSCEPCPMCLSALYWARPKKIYFGATRQDAAKAGFDDSKIYKEIEKQHVDRELPNEQVIIPEIREVFNQWINSEHKIEY